MKNTMLCMAATLGMGASAFGQAAVKPNQPLRLQSSFDLVVHASYAETAPLFGPEGERAWAGKHWNPQFVYPATAHDEDGAVFTVQHGPLSAVWLTTIFDVPGRHSQYVYFLPDLMVTRIDVRFTPLDASTTRVNVVYTRTAITPDANEHVTAMGEGDKTSGPEWQSAIDAYLARRKP
jgi:hypothetical protein